MSEPRNSGRAPSIYQSCVAGRHGPIPVRRYSPRRGEGGPSPVVVWLHGGAFSHGDLDMPESHAVALHLADAGHAVVAVDYRRVPPWRWWAPPRSGVLAGVRYPVPVDDVIDAVLHIRGEAIESGRRFGLGGASAGACLAAAATLRLVRERQVTPDFLMLAYGTFHAQLPPVSPQLRSRLRGRHGVIQFRPSTVERMNRNYAGCVEAMSDPFAFPGGHGLRGMPTTLVLDADRDSLRASGERFATELTEAGTDVTYAVVPESTHGFLNRPGKSAFDLATDRMTDWLAARNPGTPEHILHDSGHQPQSEG